jgi:hypothetical protein
MCCKEYFTFTGVWLNNAIIASLKPMDKKPEKINCFDVNENYSKTPDLNSFYGQLNIRGKFNYNFFLSDKTEEEYLSLKQNLPQEIGFTLT